MPSPLIIHPAVLRFDTKSNTCSVCMRCASRNTAKKQAAAMLLITRSAHYVSLQRILGSDTTRQYLDNMTFIWPDKLIQASYFEALNEPTSSGFVQISFMNDRSGERHSVMPYDVPFANYSGQVLTTMVVCWLYGRTEVPTRQKPGLYRSMPTIIVG